VTEEYENYEAMEELARRVVHAWEEDQRSSPDQDDEAEPAEAAGTDARR
jgi:hypothetical protein